MEGSFLPLYFPLASRATLMLIGVGVLVVAILVALEHWRRRAHLRAQVAAEWRIVEQIMLEREFTPDEVALLRGLIRRWFAESPLEVVTGHVRFNACVASEMDALSRDDTEHFSETGILLREIRVRLGLDYVPFGQRIISTRELTVGQIIWIAAGATPGAGWVKASILALDEAHFHVTARADHEPTLKLTPRAEVRCHLWREDDARYEFRTSVAFAEGSPQTWSFNHVAEMDRVQARDYYRIRYNQETSIGVLTSRSAGGDAAQERRVVTRLRGRICSLSAGGVAVVTQQPVHAQALLRMSLEIPGEDPFEVDVNTVSAESLAGGRFLVRGAFVGITEAKRDVIARYVLHRQRPKLAHPERAPLTPGTTEGK